MPTIIINVTKKIWQSCSNNTTFPLIYINKMTPLLLLLGGRADSKADRAHTITYAHYKLQVLYN